MIDLKDIKVVRGDYDVRQLDKKMNTTKLKKNKCLENIILKL